jgi:hypothetical protein
LAEPYEITDPLAQPVEPQVPVEPIPPVAEPEQPVEEEFVPYRRGDQEIPLPLEAARQIAEALGYDNPAAIINQLRNGEEAQEIMRQARTIYQQARQRAQSAPPQQVEQRWQQHVQHQQRQQPQQQPQDELDPIGLLSEMRQEIRQMRAEQQQREQYETQRNLVNLDREATREYQKFSSELKKQGVPEWKIPDRDYLLGEAEMLGLFHGDVGVGEMYRSVWKLANADAMIHNAAQSAVQSHVEKLRDPKARVSVPVSRPAPAAAPAPASTLDSMTLRDLPEGRY